MQIILAFLEGEVLYVDGRKSEVTMGESGAKIKYTNNETINITDNDVI